VIHKTIRNPAKGRSPAIRSPAEVAKIAPAASANGDPDVVKSLRKAMGILEAIAASERPLSVAELAAVTGLTRPTTHRIVQAFLSLNMYAIERNRCACSRAQTFRKTA